MSDHPIVVLDPRGVPVSDGNELAQRPASLQEATLGILSNSKPNGDWIIDVATGYLSASAWWVKTYRGGEACPQCGGQHLR